MCAETCIDNLTHYSNAQLNFIHDLTHYSNAQLNFIHDLTVTMS